MRNIFIIFFLTIFLAPALISAQVEIKATKKKMYNEYFKQVKFGKGNATQLGNKMLETAQNDYEKSLAYYVLGDAEYKIGDYLHSVKLLEKSKKLAVPSDTFDIRMSIFSLIIPAYRRAGLIVESDENWKQMKKMGEKNLPYFKNEYLIYMQAKIYDIDKEYCKAADTRQKFLQILFKQDPQQVNNYRYIYSVLTQLCYVQIKCGRITDAESTFIKTNSYLQFIKKDTASNSSNIVLEEFNYLNLALLNIERRNNVAAKSNFEKAYEIAGKKSDNLITKLILQERLDAKVDNAEQQLQFAKIVNDITQSETTITKQLTAHEAKKNQKLIAKYDLKLWVAASLFLSVSLIGFVLVYRRNKKLHQKYLSIVEELKNPITDSKRSSSNNEIVEKDIIKNIETENEILKNLQAFESKNLFTTKGISLAKMSVMLKTNTKYLNFVLKKHRNSDFYNYINTYRINHIVRRLHDEPLLLQYKISALSDICGFASHSQFTTVFKAIKDISPSQYIKFLQDKQKQVTSYH